MEAWNRKHKPKHWTKPKWNIKSSKSKMKLCRLVTRGIKDKYGNDFFFRKVNNKPSFKILLIDLNIKNCISQEFRSKVKWEED